MPNMVLKVKILVLNPVGVIKVKRHLHQFAAKGFGQVQPRFNKIQYVLKTLFAAFDCGWIIDSQRPDMHGRPGSFSIKE